MLQPKRLRYRRPSDGHPRQYSKRGNQLAFGSFGIKTLESKWITARQIEAARVAVTRYMQRQGQIWLRISPISPILASLPMSAWVKVKVMLQVTSLPFIPDASSSRSTV